MFKNTIIGARKFKLTPISEGTCLESPLRKGIAWGWAKAITIPSPSSSFFQRGSSPLQKETAACAELSYWHTLPNRSLGLDLLQHPQENSPGHDAWLFQQSQPVGVFGSVTSTACLKYQEGNFTSACLFTASTVQPILSQEGPPCDTWACSSTSHTAAAEPLPSRHTLGLLPQIVCAQPRKLALPLPRATHQPQHTSREPGTWRQAIPSPDFSAPQLRHTSSFALAFTDNAHTPHRHTEYLGPLSSYNGVSTQPAPAESCIPDGESPGQSCTLDCECKGHSYDLCCSLSLPARGWPMFGTLLPLNHVKYAS